MITLRTSQSITFPTQNYEVDLSPFLCSHYLLIYGHYLHQRMGYHFIHLNFLRAEVLILNTLMCHQIK